MTEMSPILNTKEQITSDKPFSLHNKYAIPANEIKKPARMDFDITLR